MATARRTTPGTDPEERWTQDIRNEQTAEEREAIAKLPKLPIWLEGLTPEECGKYVVWMYRKEGGNGAAESWPRVAAELAMPCDDTRCRLEEWLQEEWGGGIYRVHVKFPGSGKRPDQHDGFLRILGPAKYPERLNPKPGQAAGAAGAAATSDTVALEILRQRENPIQAAKQTLELVNEMGKTMRPEAPADQFQQLKSAVEFAKAIAPVPAAVATPPDPWETYLKINQVIRQAVSEAMPAAPQQAAQPATPLLDSIALALIQRGAVTEAIDLIKGPEAPATLGSALAEGVAAAVKERPGVTLEVWDFVRRAGEDLMTRWRTPAAAGTEQQQPSAAQPQATPAVGRVLPPEGEPTAQPGESVPSPTEARMGGLGMPPQRVIDFAFSIVVNNFRRGLDVPP